MKHECPECGKETEGTFSEGGILWAICEDCMQDELDAQEVYERNVQDYMDWKFRHEEEAACRNER